MRNLCRYRSFRRGADKDQDLSFERKIVINEFALNAAKHGYDGQPGWRLRLNAAVMAISFVSQSPMAAGSSEMISTPKTVRDLA
jgi:hypothetical protein